MPINPEIALGVKQFEMPDPLTAYAKVAAIKDAQSRNALSQLEFAKARREEATTNALNEAYRAGYAPGGIDYSAVKNSLAQGGQGSAIPAIEKYELENRKATTEAAGADEKLFNDKLASARRALDFINPEDPAAPQQYAEYLRSVYADKILGPRLTAMGAPVDKSFATLSNAVRAGKFAEFFQQSVLGVEKTIQNQIEQNKLTDYERTVIAAGYPKGSPEYRRLMQQKVNLDSTRAPTDASQLPADARMIEWLKSQDPDTQALYRQMFGKGDTGKVAQVITDNAGNVRMFTASGEEVIPKTAAGAPPPKGKPSATFEKTAAQRKQLALDLDRAIIELSTAAEDGGLIDQSTGSGLGQLADTAAGVIGQATPGAIAISKLQPIADLVLKMVPRFEGPQSDKDTQSYKEAAGQLANGNLPNAIRKAAAREIVRLMTERKGQFVSPAMADEGTSARETAAGTSSEDDPVARATKLMQDKYPGK